MATYEDLSPRRERSIREDKLMKLRSKALVLLREALHVATVSSEATKTGDPKKVWKATYEAVIASAPPNIRIMANFLRNYYGQRSVY